jgi:hypothetical protein
MVGTLAGFAENTVAVLNAVRDAVAAHAEGDAPKPKGLVKKVFKEMKTACNNITKLIRAVRRCEEIATLIKQRVLIPGKNVLPRHTDEDMAVLNNRSGETLEEWYERNKEFLSSAKLRPSDSDIVIFGRRREYLPAQFKGEDRELMSEFSELLQVINRIIGPYRAKPLINGWAAASSWKIDWEFPSVNARGLEYWERIAAMDILQIAADGKISRFRECRLCSRWFIAKTAHQAFDSEKCRQKHLAQSPQYKAKRARYMREKYRPEEKQREQRSKTLAKRARAGR